MPEAVARIDLVPLHSSTVLAFDFGIKRIGVAIGESALGVARPLTTLTETETASRFAAIERLIGEWQPAGLVVGLPFDTDGSEHEMNARCRRFAHQLEGRFRLPVTLVDERYTSAVAEDELRREISSWKNRRELLDARAAQLILQAYFDDHHDRTA